MKKIITISREFGAGGGQIGKAVANRLGYYYMDKDVIIRSAMESASLTAEDFRHYDEKVPHNFGLGQSLFDFYKAFRGPEGCNPQGRRKRKVRDRRKKCQCGIKRI